MAFPLVSLLFREVEYDRPSLRKFFLFLKIYIFFTLLSAIKLNMLIQVIIHVLTAFRADQLLGMHVYI